MATVRSPSALPALAGIAVVELGGGLASALSGLLLRDAGATVLVAEPPGGVSERLRPGYHIWNRGKQSILLDASDPASVAEVRRVTNAADVVIFQLGRDCPIASDTIDPEPAKVICAISGFGSKGKVADLPPMDDLVAAYSGLCANQAGWSPGPSYVVHPIPSTAAAVLTSQAIVAGLLERDRSCRTQWIETSLLAATLAMSGHADGVGVPRPRILGESPRGSSPFYALYECADGLWLQLGCLHAGFVQLAIDALEMREELASVLDDPRFEEGVTIGDGEVRSFVTEAVERAVAARPRSEWLERLDKVGVPVAPVRRSDEFLDDPQARTNGLMEIVERAASPIIEPGPFVRLSRSPCPPATAAPDVGVHGPLPVSKPSAEQPLCTEVRLPLTGIRVLELANIIAGPMVGRCLAELGADVIKLEGPAGGDVFRQQGAPEFLPLNAGKRSICVDLKRPEGQALGRRLADRADVVLNNMRPGVAERLGLGWESLQAANPRLVYCHVTAFGRTGPYAARPGGDPIAGAYTGMQWAQGHADHKPVYVRGAPIDYTAGMLGALGVLLALFDRRRTDLGQVVDTCLLDAGALLNCHAMIRQPGDAARDDLPTSQYGWHSLRWLYRAADDWVFVSAEQDRDWDAFGRALKSLASPEDTRFASPEGRRANAEELTAAISKTLSRRSVSDVAQAMRAQGMYCVRVNSPIGPDDDQVAANGWVATYEHSTRGKMRLFTGWLGSASRYPLRPPPELGQHNREVMADLGMSISEIDDVMSTGVVQTPSPSPGRI